MSGTLVADWFGDSFKSLHPLLQQLHRNGGKLAGTVEIDISKGVAGAFGALLARKAGIPTMGRTHELVVTFFQDAEGLHWQRYFDNSTTVTSLFKPVGKLPDGYWIESTGPLELFLTVDIKDGGWHWRCLKMKIRGIGIPLWLSPRTTAFKMIESGRYRFYVGFSLPLLGTVLSYSGLLEPILPEHADG